MIVVFTEAATIELEDIEAYLAAHDPVAAETIARGWSWRAVPSTMRQDGVK